MWVCSICALLSVGCPTPLPALTPLQETLRQADETLTELEALWPKLSERLNESALLLSQAQKQLDSLRAELTLWQENSAEWERASADSQAALTRVQDSLDGLTKRYDALSLSWQEYRKQVEVAAAARELAVKRWRTVALWGTLGALAGGFLAGWFVGK